MPRLLVHVEGQTEENFVNEVLHEHLWQSSGISVSARRLGSPRRSGIPPWQTARRDILRHLKQDTGAIHATIVDYYGLPLDWPGRPEAPNMGSTSAKARCVEAALIADISMAMGTGFDPNRFIPLVMMHEFEALLFSDPVSFAREISRPDLAADFLAIRQDFDTPEDINDSVDTAPSKRIVRLFPRYEKPLIGTLVAIEIGLTTIRNECRHFNSWLERLESLEVQP
ncbi:MAG: DUF4276 family protein [Terracidiphilus sp.]|jgi:hypothetical protein